MTSQASTPAHHLPPTHPAPGELKVGSESLRPPRVPRGILTAAVSRRSPRAQGVKKKMVRAAGFEPATPSV